MEHIEPAGIHSGDSYAVLPPFDLSEDVIKQIEQHTKTIALALNTVGLLNIQFAIKNGKVYITGFTDFTKSSGRTDGFMVYYFLSQPDFEIINKFFNYVGTVHIKDEFKNATGGTIASNLLEFRTQLNLWDKMFGDNGRIATVDENNRMKKTNAQHCISAML